MGHFMNLQEFGCREQILVQTRTEQDWRAQFKILTEKLWFLLSGSNYSRQGFYFYLFFKEWLGQHISHSSSSWH